MFDSDPDAAKRRLAKAAEREAARREAALQRVVEARRAVDRANAEYRAALRETLTLGLSVRKVAAALGVSPMTVWNRRNRAA